MYAIRSYYAWQNVVLFSSFAFAMGSAARLARFNAMESHQKSFNGMPTPAASLMIASLWLLVGHTENESLRAFLLNIYVVYGVV